MRNLVLVSTVAAVAALLWLNPSEAAEPPSVVCTKAVDKTAKMEVWIGEQLAAGRTEIVATSAGIAANGFGYPDVVCAYAEDD